MSITLEQAKKLKYREEIHHTCNRNADNSPQRWRVNGKVKTWKRNSERVQIPIKHGLYAYGYLTERNLNMFNLKSE